MAKEFEWNLQQFAVLETINKLEKLEIPVLPEDIDPDLRQFLPEDYAEAQASINVETEIALNKNLIRIINENEQQFYILTEEGKKFVEFHEQELKKVKEKNEEFLKEQEEKKKIYQIAVSDLDASLIGKNVCFEARIVGEITQLAIAKKVVCPNCKNEIEVSPYEAIFSSFIKDNCGKIALKAENVLEYYNYSILFVQNLLEQIKAYDKRFYTPKKVYIVGAKLPYAKKIRVKGKVIVSPSKEICVLADEVQPLETEVENFKITEEDRANWIKYFANNNIENLRWQIAPDMVGRPLAQESRLLVLHSPAEIPDINGKIIRGVLREFLFGDSKTCKSENVKDVCFHYHFGDYAVAESSSRAGITYTIDTDKKTIIWGVLVLNDLGYVAIDGMQKMFSEEIGEMREALESLRVIVRRSQSGEALARTRITGIANPRKPMNQYLFPCLALKDIRIFESEPDLTRWDFFIPFATGDVSPEEIARRKIRERPIPDNIFTRHVYWAWSRRPEQIEYTEEAKMEIIKNAEEMMHDYSIASLPIVHLGFRDVLTRVSVAYACLMHSTDETHEKVIVKKEHVEKAVKFYLEMLEKLKLKEYKLAEEGKLEITDNEFKQIVSELDEIDFKILESIKLEAKTSVILAKELDISQRWVKEHYSKLAKFGLVATKSGVGISLTARGVKFLHILAGKGELVQKNFTNSTEKVNKNFTNSPQSAYTPAICEYCGKYADCLKVNGRFICKECLKEEQKPKCYKCGSTLDLTQTEDYITHKPLWICKKCLEERIE